jgi:hypothetical protein
MREMAHDDAVRIKGKKEAATAHLLLPIAQASSLPLIQLKTAIKYFAVA